MVGAIAMLFGGVMSAYGQARQGRAAMQAGEYNARIAEENATLSVQQAQDEERRFRSMVKRQLGDTRAAIGASGVALEGSPLDVLEDSAAQAEMDALTIKHQGEVKAHAYRQEAGMQRQAGRLGLEASRLGAASTLLSATGQALSYGKRV